MSSLAVLMIAAMFGLAPSPERSTPATVQMSSSAAETPEIDRALGIQRVRTFDELVSCIRGKNSADDVKAFGRETAMDAKVKRYSELTQDCWTAAGANLNLDFEALDRALSGERRAN